jgi:hypothetical protein
VEPLKRADARRTRFSAPVAEVRQPKFTCGGVSVSRKPQHVAPILYDLKRKANTDARNAGASAKERMAIVGHTEEATNRIYESIQPKRLREIADQMGTFTLSA